VRINFCKTYWLTIHSQIVFIHTLLPLQLGMAICYQHDKPLISPRLTRITSLALSLSRALARAPELRCMQPAYLCRLPFVCFSYRLLACPSGMLLPANSCMPPACPCHISCTCLSRPRAHATRLPLPHVTCLPLLDACLSRLYATYLPLPHITCLSRPRAHATRLPLPHVTCLPLLNACLFQLYATYLPLPHITCLSPPRVQASCLPPPHITCRPLLDVTCRPLLHVRLSQPYATYTCLCNMPLACLSGMVFARSS